MVRYFVNCNKLRNLKLNNSLALFIGSATWSLVSCSVGLLYMNLFLIRVEVSPASHTESPWKTHIQSVHIHLVFHAHLGVRVKLILQIACSLAEQRVVESNSSDHSHEFNFNTTDSFLARSVVNLDCSSCYFSCYEIVFFKNDVRSTHRWSYAYESSNIIYDLRLWGTDWYIDVGSVNENFCFASKHRSTSSSTCPSSISSWNKLSAYVVLDSDW